MQHIGNKLELRIALEFMKNVHAFSMMMISRESASLSLLSP